MKRSRLFKYKYFMLLLIIMTCFFTVHIVKAVTAATTATTATPDPGSDSDPVITQSYVDQKIAELGVKLDAANTTINDLTQKLSDSNQKIAKITEANDLLNKQIKDIDPESFKFQPVELKAGQMLIAGASAELIVRSGQAKAIAGKFGGLSDITAAKGTDLGAGAAIADNHLLLVSRDDGRGIKAVTGCWLIVKGTYTIKDK
ncbi:MAG: hypothetical protein Q8942_02660 [Bacillota bacterium]|nr:hypothetical protein [Bacillota bacterium]